MTQDAVLGCSTMADLERLFDNEGKMLEFIWYDLGKEFPVVAVCEYSQKVAKSSIHLFNAYIVRDFMVIPEKWCEENQRCLDVSCPLNKTTEESLAREYRVSISKIPKGWNRASERLTRHLRKYLGEIEQESRMNADPLHEIPAIAPRQRKPIKARQRFRILERDNFRCRYCGRNSSAVVLHIDHIVPVSKGGSNDDDNLLVACEDCNLGKAARLLDSWLAS